MRPAERNTRAGTWRRRLAGVTVAAALTVILADPCRCPGPEPDQPGRSDHGCCTGPEGLQAATPAPCCPDMAPAQVPAGAASVAQPTMAPLAGMVLDLARGVSLPPPPSAALRPRPPGTLRI
jgi:hypothetical protein